MNKSNLGLIFLGLFPTIALADMMETVQPVACWLPVMSLSGGPAWNNNGKTQTIFLQPNIEKTYTAAKKERIFASGEVFLGWQRALYSSVFGQLGFAFAVSTTTKLSGDVWEGANPQFNDFSYQYKANYSVISLRGKLLTKAMYSIQPYLNGSFGVGFNNAHGFALRPKLLAQLPNPPFISHTKTGFSYTLGLGLQTAINSHWQVGLGYEFADRGQFRLDKIVGQTLDAGLRLNHLYIQQLQFSLSYLA